jgi:hypothetical protein
MSNQAGSNCLHDRIVNLFRGFLNGEEHLLAAINDFGKSLAIDSEQWQFKLPDLYEFCCTWDDSFRKVYYRKFRHIVYSNPTGDRIASYGGSFKIVCNEGNIDQNTYALLSRRTYQK